MMPTMQEVEAAYAVVKLFRADLCESLAPIFAAARRGIEAEWKLNKDSQLFQIECQKVEIANLKAELAALKAAQPQEAPSVPYANAGDKRRCHAPGPKCFGCPHYHGKADVCEYAPRHTMSDERIEQIYDETAGAMGDDYAHAGWLAFARALLAAARCEGASMTPERIAGIAALKLPEE